MIEYRTKVPLRYHGDKGVSSFNKVIQLVHDGGLVREALQKSGKGYNRTFIIGPSQRRRSFHEFR